MKQEGRQNRHARMRQNPDEVEKLVRVLLCLPGEETRPCAHSGWMGRVGV